VRGTMRDDDAQDRALEDKFDFLHDEGLIDGSRVLSERDVRPCATCFHWEKGPTVDALGTCTEGSGNAYTECDEWCSLWEARPRRQR